MHRLKSIDIRLEKWARWMEGGGRLGVAPFARMTKVDNDGPQDSERPMIHAEEWETDAMVKKLPFAQFAIVYAMYLGRYDLLELATIAGNGRAKAEEVLAARAIELDKKTGEVIRTGPPGSAHAGSAKARIALAMGVSEETVRMHLCRADRDIERQIRARQRGEQAPRERPKVIRLPYASVTVD
jgi:hypothetical protein